MVWCHLNDEARTLRQMIPGSVEISGSDNDDSKEAAARWFVHGEEQRRVLISKPKIFGFGLNFQHCAHMTYFPTHSYEQYYQATRRLWRFGQTRPVLVDLIYTDGGERMMENLARKGQEADKMFDALTRHMNQAMAVKTEYKETQVEVPGWMLNR
jgi:SNF2 family DNA or RNA helicase